MAGHNGQARPAFEDSAFQHAAPKHSIPNTGEATSQPLPKPTGVQRSAAKTAIRSSHAGCSSTASRGSRRRRKSSS